MKKMRNYADAIQKDVAIDEVISLAQQQQTLNASKNEFASLNKLYPYLKQQKKAVSYGFYLSGKLLASCVFFFSHYRAYYVLAGNHPEGRKISASTLLIDAFIKDYAGQNLLLDFEGSDVPGIAFFFRNFGSTNEKYTSIKYNRLPWLISWVK
ncbi:MAG: GNAT family N-acetyltransferase [Chitinophagaceae bacterium]